MRVRGNSGRRREVRRVNKGGTKEKCAYEWVCITNIVKNCAKKKKTTVSLTIHEQIHLDKSIFVFGEERGEGEGRREKGKGKRDTGHGKREKGEKGEKCEKDEGRRQRERESRLNQ